MFGFKVLQAQQIVICLNHVLNIVNYTGRRACRSCSINVIVTTVHTSSTMDRANKVNMKFNSDNILHLTINLLKSSLT